MFELPNKKEERIKKEKTQNLARLGNTMIENFIKDGNIYTYKILYYLAKDSLDLRILENNEETIGFLVNKKALANYLNIDPITIDTHIFNMQKTSASYYDEKEKAISYVSVLPKITPLPGSYKIKMFKDFFKCIQMGALGFDPKKGNYTIIKNLDKLMSLKNLHSVRMFVLLNRIRDFGDGAKQQLTLSLEEINKYFGVNYEKSNDIDRKLLKPIGNELIKLIPFSYEAKYNMEAKGKGRKPVIGYTFYYKSNTINKEEAIKEIESIEDILNKIEE